MWDVPLHLYCCQLAALNLRVTVGDDHHANAFVLQPSHQLLRHSVTSHEMDRSLHLPEASGSFSCCQERANIQTPK